MLHHIGTQTIGTDRLILRRFTPDDAPQMYRNWACDPEVTRYLRWRPHANVTETENLLREWVDSYRDPGRYHWVIVLRETGQPIGSIGILDVRQADEAAEIGYCIGKAWWGRGLMTEALTAVLSFGFDRCRFNRLEACHSVNNPASGRVMEKAGMVLEGTARQKYRCALGFQDCRIYAALKDDWDREGARRSGAR